MAIATGGVVPDGADSVVPIEDVEERENEVVGPGRRPRGRERARPRRRPPRAAISSSRPACGSGPVHLGALAAAGVTHVRCHRAPRVVVAVTGTELRSPGEPLERGRDLRRERRHPGDADPQHGRECRAAAAGAGTTPRRRARRSRAVSRPTCSSRAAASRSASTTSCARPRPSSASRRSSGASRCGRESRSPSAFAAERSCSGCRATRSRRSSASSCSSGRRCSRSRASPIRSRPSGPAGSGRATQLVPGRDSLLRARSRVEDGEVVLEPLTGQESHMIAQAATADALVLVPRRRGRARGRQPGLLPRPVARPARGAGARERASTIERTSSRTGPRGPRSPASGYGA